MTTMTNELYLAHHGIKGQKWGVRRFQNEDWSLTSAGKKRYSEGDTRRKLSSKQKAFIAAGAAAVGIALASYGAYRYSESVKTQAYEKGKAWVDDYISGQHKAIDDEIEDIQRTIGDMKKSGESPLVRESLERKAYETLPNHKRNLEEAYRPHYAKKLENMRGNFVDSYDYLHNTNLRKTTDKLKSGGKKAAKVAGAIGLEVLKSYARG